MDEVNALLDIALEVLVGDLEQLLLVVVGLADYIDRLLGTSGLYKVSVVTGLYSNNTYAKLDWNGEEVDAGSLRNTIATSNARKIDEAGLDDALFALNGLDNLFGEPETSIGHGKCSGTGAILGLNDFVTAKLYACKHVSF